MWLNVGIMLNNCFVLSNMIRHGLADVEERAANKVQKFLSQTNDRMKREFWHFKDYMTILVKRNLRRVLLTIWSE